MLFSELSHFLQKLESTTSRNTMVEILAELFAKAKSSEISEIMYLLQGRVAPIYEKLEMGMADKMMFKSLAQAFQKTPEEVEKLYQKSGDLGTIAENLSEKKHDGLTVSDAFQVLLEVAQVSGDGAVEKKVNLVAKLLQQLDPLSARFVSRIPVGKLRLGFSDMTVLDSLSWMLSKSKEHRAEIERAFNVYPDLGMIGKVIKEDGVKGLLKIKPKIGTPILMAKAERLSSGEEIIEKIGKCAVESKYDGLRLQVHYKKNVKFPISNIQYQNSEGLKKQIKIFTRNLEEVTHMFPDIVAGVKKQIKADEVIIEGEAIAYNATSGEFLPFQETTQRRRKYDIEEKAKEIPLKLICFEILYVDSKNMITETFEKRRKMLESVIGKGETLELSELEIVEKPKEVELLFDDAISRGLEGILAKRLEGVYQAGARGWNWIKFKRSYSATLNDTIDCVVMGYNLGQGKRTDFGIGAFLIGVYDKKLDKFVTVAKIGTGLTDDEWRELQKRCQKLKAKEKPPLYEVSKMLEPDIWVEPEILVEIRADEITRSPVHTAGRIMKPSKSGDALEVDVPGYALRFPRLEKFRDDKKIDDTTTLVEVEEMFEKQSKHRAK